MNYNNRSNPEKFYKNVKPEFTDEQYIEYLNSIGKSDTKSEKQIEFREILDTKAKYKITSYINTSDWFDANMKIYYKKNSPTEPKNYRPLIYLNPVTNNIESYLQSHYKNSMKHNNNIQLMGKLNIAVQKVYDIGVNIGSGVMLFLDIENAYGSVKYDLLKKMLKNTELKDYFKLFYEKVNVMYNDKKIKWNNGLIQGSPLSMLYFLLYIDYALYDIKDIADQIVAYSDDLMIYFNTTDNLQEKIQKISDIFQQYNLKFNSDKSFYYCLTKQDITLNDKKIVSVDKKFIYLGIHIFNIKSESKILCKKIKKIKSLVALKKHINKYIKTYQIINTVNPLGDLIEKLIKELTDRYMKYNGNEFIKSKLPTDIKGYILDKKKNRKNLIRVIVIAKGDSDHEIDSEEDILI